MKNIEIKTYTFDEWQNEGKRRFGDDYMNWEFQCPMCGKVSSVRDFKEAGAADPNCAYTECIGRYTGQGTPTENSKDGCNWCAYGLFGIPKGGVYVEKDGEKTHIFDFAEQKCEEGE